MHEVIHTPLISFNPTLVMNMITLLVLFLVLKKFFWEKVRAFMQARQDKITDAFDNADQVNRLADERLEEYNDKLSAIESQKRDVIKNATLQAEERNRLMLEETNKKINDMMIKAREEIEREKNLAVADLKDQISALSILAAEKIIGEELKTADTDPIIEEVIGKVYDKRDVDLPN
jgi:F-type H+-transporting ATPase subunit b